MHIRPCTADVAAEATDVDPSAVEAPDAGAGSRAVEAASSLEPILLAATAGNGAGSDANDEGKVLRLRGCPACCSAFCLAVCLV